MRVAASPPCDTWDSTEGSRTSQSGEPAPLRPLPEKAINGTAGKLTKAGPPAAARYAAAQKTTLASPSHAHQLLAQHIAAAAANPPRTSHCVQLPTPQSHTHAPQRIHMHDKKCIRHIHIYKLVDKSVCQLHSGPPKHTDAHRAQQRPASERRTRDCAHACVTPLVVAALRANKVQICKVTAPAEVLEQAPIHACSQLRRQPAT